jgi:hypothetical protein
MTVEEYRKKHKRCKTCKHLYSGFALDRCKAKNFTFLNSVDYTIFKGCFCKLYEPKEYKENDR